MLTLGILIPIILVFGALILLPILYRRVVETNEVHIVQSRKSTTSYGKTTENGNTYYQWPAWIPGFGVTTSVLPTSVFDLDLRGYEAYDVGRLPFVVDVKAFFRITDSNMAAERVENFSELHSQLMGIVQGAVRTVLASSDIEEIMTGRSEFGNKFTKEIQGQLKDWGVAAVKNLELMDIRDAGDSHVIHNIMAKKKSHIEMESRTEVAKNKKLSQVAEIEAERETQIKTQEAKQSVGIRTVEQEREVNLANEDSLQVWKDAQRVTAEKEMAVKEVTAVKEADIKGQVDVVEAGKARDAQVLAAEGKLEAAKREAEGTRALGEAEADAKKAMELAPVQAQITLAKEIGENTGYQTYLVSVDQIKATQAIGIEQAKALEAADIKIIANTGKAPEGLDSVGSLFSSWGGQQVGAMLEGFKNTEAGEKLLGKTKVKTKAIHDFF